MVTKIKEYKEDPNKKQRGSGAYYLRGPVTSKLRSLGYTGSAYYSRYTKQRDFKVLSQGWPIDKIGIPRETKYPHVSDGRIQRWTPSRKKK